MKIAIITNIIPSYREGFYNKLFNKREFKVTVYCQDRIPNSNISTIHHKYKENVYLVHFLCAKNEIVGFQFLPIRKIIKDNDVIFFDGNPRIISNIVFGFFSLFYKNKRFIIWSMAHSYGSKKHLEWIRLKWTSLFRNIFVYTDKEVESLRERGFVKHNIIGMNNGLDQCKIDAEVKKWDHKKLNKWKAQHNFEDKTIILSSARLVHKNKYNQVIEALKPISKSIPNILWCVVGSGENEQTLKKMSKIFEVEEYIYFAGAIFEEEKLAPFFLSSKIFVYPGSIGLSLMHAFGYGLPVVIHNNEQMHGPEYGAFINNETGKSFEENNVRDLVNCIISLINSTDELQRMQRNVSKIARESYNTDVMVDRFLKIATNN